MGKLPGIVKAFASFSPSSDNHKVNLALDVVGLVAWMFFALFHLMGLNLLENVTYEQLQKSGFQVFIGLCFVFLLAALCVKTTFFREPDADGRNGNTRKRKAKPAQEG